MKKDTGVVPTNTLFMTFNTPDLPKEIPVGYLEAKVSMFAPNPMRSYNCSDTGHPAPLPRSGGVESQDESSHKSIEPQDEWSRVTRRV